MSKPDMEQIEFHARVAVTRDEIKQSKMDIIRYKCDNQARDFGKLIADTKGWNMEPAGDLVMNSLDLYVFTRNELKDFVDAKIKEHLILMSERV